LSKHKIRPGDTPFTKLLFTNRRTNAVKITVTAKSTETTQPAAVPIDCPASVTTEWTPPNGLVGWTNICQLTINIQKTVLPIAPVGTISCETPAVQDPNPPVVASSAKCELRIWQPMATTNCVLDLLDGAEKSQASTNSLVQASN